MSRPSRWYIFSTTTTSSSLSSPLSIIMIIIISLSLIQPSLTTHDTWLSRFINNLLWLDSSSNKLLIKLIAPVKVACQKYLNVCTLWGQTKTSLIIDNTSQHKYNFIYNILNISSYTRNIINFKGSRHVRKVQFFLTLFKRPLAPPPFVWTSCGEFLKWF